MIEGLLYRGINFETHKNNDGQLRPKENTEFKKAPKWNVAQWGSSWSLSEKNAVNEHQHNQSGNPTSGISTTPHKVRAEYYALHNGMYEKGVVYVLDPKLCKKHSVSIYVVADFVTYPAIPVDNEVILVAQNFGSLPLDIIVDMYCVSA